MRNIGLIFRQTAARNRRMILLSAASAVLMILFFGLLAAPAEESIASVENSGVRIGIIDRDESALSEDLKKYFTDRLGMELYEEKNYDFQADRLIDRKISAIIEIPDGLYEGAAAGELPPLTVTMLDDYENAAFIEVYANSYMRSAAVLSTAAKGDEARFRELLSANAPFGETKAIERRGEDDATEQTNHAFFTVTGFMLMFMAMIVFFLSYMILSDRQGGVYSRIVCSVIKPTEYVIGVSLFGIICLSAVNLIYTLCVFAMSGSLSLPLWLVLLANELFILFLVGVSVLFALLVNGNQPLIAIGIGYTTIGSMLGGFWFPIADGLGAVGQVAKLFPHYWVMDLYRNYAADPAANVPLCLSILALFVLLAYLISAIVFTRKN